MMSQKKGLRPLSETLWRYPVFPGNVSCCAVQRKIHFGAPACVYYNRNKCFYNPYKTAAGERMYKNDMVKLSYGGLCLQCDECHYPDVFGKGL